MRDKDGGSHAYQHSSNSDRDRQFYHHYNVDSFYNPFVLLLRHLSSS
jgi:hypothetical protein